MSSSLPSPVDPATILRFMAEETKPRENPDVPGATGPDLWRSYLQWCTDQKLEPACKDRRVFEKVLRRKLRIRFRCTHVQGQPIRFDCLLKSPAPAVRRGRPSAEAGRDPCPIGKFMLYCTWQSEGSAVLVSELWVAYQRWRTQWTVSPASPWWIRDIEHFTQRLQKSRYIPKPDHAVYGRCLKSPC